MRRLLCTLIVLLCGLGSAAGGTTGGVSVKSSRGGYIKLCRRRIGAIRHN